MFSPKGGTNQTKHILLKQINSTECPYNSKYSCFLSLIKKVYCVFTQGWHKSNKIYINLWKKELVSGSFDFLRWSEESITSFDVRNPLGIDQILRVPGRYFFKSNCSSLWPIIMKIIDNNIIYFACLGFFLKKMLSMFFTCLYCVFTQGWHKSNKIYSFKANKLYRVSLQFQIQLFLVSY